MHAVPRNIWAKPQTGCFQLLILEISKCVSLMIIALSAVLTSCTGDRVKQGQSTGTPPPLILTA
jgi:hypothetical protein